MTGRALSLRMRWRRLCELVDSSSLWPREALEAVAKRVEGEGAVRAQYERAAAMWAPLREVQPKRPREEEQEAEGDGFEL